MSAMTIETTAADLCELDFFEAEIQQINTLLDEEPEKESPYLSEEKIIGYDDWNFPIYG